MNAAGSITIYNIVCMGAMGANSFYGGGGSGGMSFPKCRQRILGNWIWGGRWRCLITCNYQ